MWVTYDQCWYAVVPPPKWCLRPSYRAFDPRSQVMGLSRLPAPNGLIAQAGPCRADAVTQGTNGANGWR